MATDYSQLVNKGGTVYNTATQKAYSDPNQLAGDLGVNASGIQWGSITKNDAYNPIPTNQTQTPPPTGNQAGGLSFEAVKASQQSEAPKFDQQGMLVPGTGGLSAQGFQAAKDSGQPAPQDKSLAMNQVEGFTPPAPPDLSKIDNTLQNDPQYQQLLQDRTDYTNAVNQQQNLVSTYQQMITQAGIPALDTQLLNTEKIINGTENDIRTEVQAAHGLATDSQVLALASSRNKNLIQNYNNLLQTKTNAMNQVNTMIGLAKEDRANALNSITQKLQIDEQINAYRDKMVSAAKEGYQNIISAVGYGGLLATLSSDPSAVSVAEKTLGLQPGGLQQMVNAGQAQTNLANLKAAGGVSTPFVNVNGEIQNAKTGQAYSTPEAFFKAAGISDWSQAKNLVSNMPVPIEQQLKQADLASKQAQLTTEKAQQANIYSQIASRNKPAVQPGTTDLSNFSSDQQQKFNNLGLSSIQAQNALGIVSGERPPLTGFGMNSKEGQAVTAGALALGYDMVKASNDWTAMQKRIATMNGTQQVRLQQAINFSYDSLDIIDQLNNEWKGGQFPLLNKANLAVAKAGGYGQQAQSLATRFDAQINDLTSELGTVYKGGNSSTDESLKLAAGNLSSNWSQKTLQDAINLARTNLQIRKNSISNSSNIPGNQYDTANQETPASSLDYNSYLNAIK